MEVSHVELPPESLEESTPPKPKYLELIYHPDDDENTTPQPISQPVIANKTDSLIINSDYEVPITDLILRASAKLSESNFNRNMECVVVGDVKTVL